MMAVSELMAELCAQLANLPPQAHLLAACVQWVWGVIERGCVSAGLDAPPAAASSSRCRGRRVHLHVLRIIADMCVRLCVVDCDRCDGCRRYAIADTETLSRASAAGGDQATAP